MKNAIIYINDTEAQVTKAFAKQARIFGTPEYKLQKEYRKDFPEAKMVTKTIKKNASKRTYNNLTYANMEKYIGVFQNADKLLTQFEVVKRQSGLEKSPYQFVLSRFLEQFPDYQELPDFNEKAKNIIDLGAFMKKKENVQQQEKAGA